MQRVLASWFGTGLLLGRIRGSDLGSGTVSSVFAFPIAFAMGHWWGWGAQLAAAVGVIVLSLWAVRPFVSDDADPGWITVDEAAGVFVALVGLTFWPAVVAWAVFRIADIQKRWAPGVAAAEKLGGPVGVTADDVVAGLYGLVAGHVVMALI